MAKFNKKTSIEKQELWADAKAKLAKAEAAKIAALDPYILEFNERTKPIHERHDKKIAALRDEAAVLEKEVLEALEDAGPIRLETERTVAEHAVGVKVGNRVASVKKLLGYVAEKGEDVIYGCLGVVLKTAETVIGKKELDEICTKTETPFKEVTLKLK